MSKSCTGKKYAALTISLSGFDFLQQALEPPERWSIATDPKELDSLKRSDVALALAVPNVLEDRCKGSDTYTIVRLSARINDVESMDSLDSRWLKLTNTSTDENALVLFPTGGRSPSVLYKRIQHITCPSSRRKKFDLSDPRVMSRGVSHNCSYNNTKLIPVCATRA